ncbi:MAG: hypothetical protein ACKPKO_22850, partial [Candidatus Fonsibacter sp.]
LRQSPSLLAERLQWLPARLVLVHEVCANAQDGAVRPQRRCWRICQHKRSNCALLTMVAHGSLAIVDHVAAADLIACNGWHRMVNINGGILQLWQYGKACQTCRACQACRLADWEI